MPYIEVEEFLSASLEELKMHTEIKVYLTINHNGSKIHQFCEALTKCSNLQIFHLNVYSLDGRFVSSNAYPYNFHNNLLRKCLHLLMDALLPLAHHLKQISFAGNILAATGDLPHPLIRLLRNCSKLELLNLSGSAPTRYTYTKASEEFIEIIKTIQHKPLIYLNLRSCFIGNNKNLINILSDTIQTLTNLQELNLSDNILSNLNQDLHGKLFKSIESCYYIKKIDLSDNYHDFKNNDAFQFFISMVEKNFFLEEISLKSSTGSMVPHYLESQKKLNVNINNLRDQNYKQLAKTILLCCRRKNLISADLGNHILTTWFYRPSYLKLL